MTAATPLDLIDERDPSAAADDQAVPPDDRQRAHHELLDGVVARTRRRFRDVLNERLRRGFSPHGRKSGKGVFTVEPFRTRGFAPGVDPNKRNQLLDPLETQAQAR